MYTPFHSLVHGHAAIVRHPATPLLLFTVSVLWAMPAAVQADEPTTLAQCAELQDDAKRLACFDRLSRTDPVPPPAAPEAPADGTAPQAQDPMDTSASASTSTVTAPPAAEPAPPPAAAPRRQEPLTEEDFGLEQQRVAEAQVIDRITAGVIGGFQGWTERTVFELDNGQIWEQISSRHFNYAGPDRQVEIRRAAFGSFFLSPVGLNSKVRVRRLE
ncbi:MAG: hypothetical protein AAGF32_02130 [Pseudomonadota bacterium]